MIGKEVCESLNVWGSVGRRTRNTNLPTVEEHPLPIGLKEHWKLPAYEVDWLLHGSRWGVNCDNNNFGKNNSQSGVCVMNTVSKMPDPSVHPITKLGHPCCLRNQEMRGNFPGGTGNVECRILSCGREDFSFWRQRPVHNSPKSAFPPLRI